MRNFTLPSARGPMATGELERLTDLCLEARDLLDTHALVDRSGTPAMRTMVRMLLLQVGRELAEREAGPPATPGRH